MKKCPICSKMFEHKKNITCGKVCGRKLSAKNCKGKSHPQTFESKEKIRKALKERWNKEGTYRKRIIDAFNKFREKSLGRPDISKGPLNRACKNWAFRSPLGIVYKFKNIVHFVENNENLFSPSDCVWIYKPDGKVRMDGTRRMIKCCKATGGLFSLGWSQRSKKPYGSWKGWTVYSQTEKFENNGKDLLNRQIYNENN